MPDDLIHLRFPDNYGRAWIELLESPLSEHARICYVAMTSFGKESRAGKEAIRRRMGVKSLSTVKGAQAELIAAGWIKRIFAGGGQRPNEWDVLSKPFDGQLPLLGAETPSRNMTGAYSAPVGAVQRPTPGRTTAPKQEDKHELKHEKLNTPVGAQAPAAEPKPEHTKGFGYLVAAFKKLPSPPIITERLGIEVGRVNRKAQGVGLKDFQRVVDAYCRDEYAGKSIGNFLSVFDRLANKLLGAEREVAARKVRERKRGMDELAERLAKIDEEERNGRPS